MRKLEVSSVSSNHTKIMAFTTVKFCVQNRITSVFSPIVRRISTTCVLSRSKKNFRKFPYIDRGTSKFNERQRTNPFPHLPNFRYGREPGYWDKDHNLVVVPEMVPEIIVPDLTGFKLKPYVSHRVPESSEPEFTAKDLFNVVYAAKIEEDFKEGKLDGNGLPLEPSKEELLTAEEARNAHLKLGSDVFTDVENIVNDSELMKEQPKMEYN
ncbi:39S ribosomal protein L41, mitochondrial [Frankliniella fusca]|uniref:39S ribosomal protein L41, mitochondrial n=1 Tax=Frankliniella fusca TaxID=407009 RepID=A0AAE1H386_9NEOP|nr:39S ribosomal protein L41, mitochondrial [Frankliniella fusca]